MRNEDTQNKVVEEQQPTAEAPKAPENAPARKPRRGRRRRRRFGLPLTLVAILVFLALLAGIVAGFAFGTKRSQAKIAALQAENAQLSIDLEDASGEEVDIFTDTPTPQEQEALDQLSGESMTVPEEDIAGVLSGDVFGESDDAATAEPVVVAEYDGGTILSDEAQRVYAERVAESLLAGTEETAEGSELMAQVLEDLVLEDVLAQQAEKLGVTDFTDEDNAEIDARAQAEYDRQLEQARAFLGEEADEDAAKTYLEESEGVTLDAIRETVVQEYTLEKLREQVVQDVTVSDEEVTARYEELLDAQRAEFEDSADAYEYARDNGDIITYNLSGYRAVDMILYPVRDADAVQQIAELTEQIAALDPETEAEQIAALNGELDVCYTTADARGKALTEKLESGTSFEKLMKEQGEEARVSTVYISEASPMWAQEVRTAAAALENIGDYSAPVRTGSGVCVMRYAADVPAGEVACEDVAEDIRTQLLQEAQSAAYDAQVAAWLEEAAPTYYPERMQ